MRKLSCATLLTGCFLAMFLCPASSQQIRFIDLRSRSAREMAHSPRERSGFDWSGPKPSQGLVLTLVSLDSDRYYVGDTIHAIVRVTNGGDKPVLLPGTTNQADVEPQDVSQGYKFWKLVVSMSLGQPGVLRAFAKLDGALYGSEVSHTMMVLRPGESIEIESVAKIEGQQWFDLLKHDQFSANVELWAVLEIRNGTYIPATADCPATEQTTGDVAISSKSRSRVNLTYKESSRAFDPRSSVLISGK